MGRPGGAAKSYTIIGTGQTKCYDNRSEISTPTPATNTILHTGATTVTNLFYRIKAHRQANERPGRTLLHPLGVAAAVPAVI
jgi:hypothetical protein